MGAVFIQLKRQTAVQVLTYCTYTRYIWCGGASSRKLLRHRSLQAGHTGYTKRSKPPANGAHGQTKSLPLAARTCLYMYIRHGSAVIPIQKPFTFAGQWGMNKWGIFGSQECPATDQHDAVWYYPGLFGQNEGTVDRNLHLKKGILPSAQTFVAYAASQNQNACGYSRTNPAPPAYLPAYPIHNPSYAWLLLRIRPLPPPPCLELIVTDNSLLPSGGEPCEPPPRAGSGEMTASPPRLFSPASEAGAEAACCRTRDERHSATAARSFRR